MPYEELSSPAVVVDLDIATHNIKTMVDRAKEAGIRHRPHVKTHKSVYFAKLQLSLGAIGITCAKLSEAEVMAGAGIDDIFVAYSLVGEEKLARFDALHDRVRIASAVNSPEGARALSDFAQGRGKRYRVLVEVDGHTGRGGLAPGRPAVDFARIVAALPGLELAGMMYFGGDVYSLATREEIEERCREESRVLARTKELMAAAGIPMDWVSAGSSFSSKYPQLLAGIDEVRAGTYIFNDCSQLSIGMVGVENCALRVVATVIARPDETHAVIDAGSKTLTSDLCAHRPGHGYVVGREDIIIDHLAEEHGFLVSQQPIDYAVGQRIQIIPSHVCPVVNLCDHLHVAQGGKVSERIRVDARGCNF